MRHATDEDLNALEEVLVALRKMPQLRERKRGNFSRGAGAFLHFHEDAGNFFVDAKLNGSSFERMRVTSPVEQTAFLASVSAALQV